MKMQGALPFLAMVVAQISQVGLTFAGKKAIETGMQNFSYVFYSNALTCLILLPAVFLIHRPPNRPPLTPSAVGGFLVLGILGFLAQVVGYAGVAYVSATVATAILNLIPAFTFVIAVIFGVERLDNGRLAMWVKIIGTAVSVLGAIIVTFYTGPAVIKTSHLSSISSQPVLGQSSHWILGGLLLLIDSVIAALFIVTQALILKKYSAVLIVMLGYCSTIVVLSFLASLILEHDLNAFSLKSKPRLLAILYSGFFGAGFQVTIGSWCVKMKGPLFVAMFHPLGIVIAAVLGVLFLGDVLYLGCLIGSAVIVIGFYSVMWGKSKEDKNVQVESLNAPLLEDKSEEHTAAETVEKCPDVMTVASSSSLFGTFQSALLAIIVERDPVAWRLQFDMGLLVIVLTAIFGSVIKSHVHMWCIQRKNQFYVVMFKPLGVPIAGMFGCIFFAETFHYGSLMAAAITGIGYYTMIWGQITDDESRRAKVDLSEERAPLLQFQGEEEV
ncbi:hypothetical protein SSX86_017308 [Deinandra increscens subsp. villosa]|uniref:EamA domain-containing protein n=1 Tax=Deinandra increscens subsp. villosa TaxID=3103831 RepID=A0AAP0CZA8_9ASTR